ncbi:Hsp70 family protein [Pseudonocardia charpentierae]|uniref:Hsp70 family protein n=1 Tax=Pseudonocardia charpentierae TaxID=3075545 RepID=A0ABU2N3A4_9PSEU|nr:Hsp70 family protein [Pseudonocardia sp. DSM 45834]MDT0348226.1 Hsp70 family protein [Pseudonocardia sp. DSM 45834]
MSYQLGIDFGTTFTAAAVRRAEGPGDTEVVPLGGRDGVPSVLHLARDERVTVGEAAAGLAGIDPTRVVRGLKRRVGDPEPVMLGGHPWSAEELSARLLRWVVDRVAEREGEAPARIALAHPATWSAHTLERLAAALAGHGLGVTFVAEPRAAAHAVAAGTAPGDALAVFDVGGGRSDAAVLRRGGASGDGFAVLGVPEAIADLGGLDIDELVWQHVRTSLPDDVQPVARVRRACTLAKETLSSEPEVVVRIRRGEFRGAVRLERATFEGLIAPHVDRTVDALDRTIASAGLEPGDLAALLLVGGSARIPLVERAVTAQLGCVPTVHTDPDLVARGAVLALATVGVDEPAPVLAVSAPLAVTSPDSEADDAEESAAEEAAVEEAAAEETAVEETVQSGEVSADPGADAPTLVFALPMMDVPTTRITSVATPVEPAAPAQPAGRPSGRVRNSAVLDPTIPGPRRSLPRMLVGVGAVIVAALVLVALFRPDGPLDPPLDPTAVDGTHQTAVPIPVGSERSAVVPAPVAGVRAEMDLDPPRTTAVRPVKERPAGSRPSVTTTPPTIPESSDLPTRVPSRAGGVRAEAAAPVMVTPREASVAAPPVV